MNDMSNVRIAEPKAATNPADPAALLRDLLTAQIFTLDAMFTELVGDAASSRPYLDSTAIYTRLALRAQANCRTSLQAVERAARTEHQTAEK